MKSSPKHFITAAFGAMFAAGVLCVSGCAAVPDPEPHGRPWTAAELENALAEDGDPIEGFNRSMFACTDFLMTYLADPVSRVYASLLPRPVIDHLDNVCVNLEFPARAVSDLCRAEWRGAWHETLRFLLNTTVGIAGIFDPAEAYWELYSTESNFGLAFASWGIGPGCSFMLPVLSATNVRDTVGTLFDAAFDLKTYIPYSGWVTFLNRVAVAERSYAPLVAQSADRYYTFREAMLVRRELLQRMSIWNLRTAMADARREAAAKEADAEAETEPVEPPPIPEPEPKPEWVTARWTPIPGYEPRSPVLDSIRVAMFQALGDDDPWYLRLSIFNSDFSKQRDDREIRPFGGDLPPMRYGLWMQPEPETSALPEDESPDGLLAQILRSPQRLLILLPGIGGNYSGMTVTALAELAYRHGFAVVTLDSPFTWQYCHASGRLPGFVVEDAEDLRRVIRAVLADLRGEFGPRAWEITLAGYSLGGLHTLKIADLERFDNTLGIDRYVAINPPADLAGAMRTADALTGPSAEWSQAEAISRLADAVTRAYLALRARYPHYDPERAREAAERGEPPIAYGIDLPRAQAEFLAAVYFRMSLRDLLMTAHRDRGLPLETPYSWNHRNALYLELDRIGFQAYAEKILAPTEYPGIVPEELYRRSSLRDMGRSLRENPKLRVLHNFDDFLLNDDDRKFLDRTFGDRLIWFDRGGHLGNLYVTTVQRAFLDAAAVTPLKDF